VPEGSTARFVKDGTLPGEAHGAATGWPAEHVTRRTEPPWIPRRLAPAGDLFNVKLG
jgi:hypothetical protein